MTEPNQNKDPLDRLRDLRPDFRTLSPEEQLTLVSGVRTGRWGMRVWGGENDE